MKKTKRLVSIDKISGFVKILKHINKAKSNKGNSCKVGGWNKSGKKTRLKLNNGLRKLRQRERIGLLKQIKEL